ncbi:MAG: hypothetical protein AVDCRST_MAG79-930, partial [uncultured Thermoleophilia bacterium]
GDPRTTSAGSRVLRSGQWRPDRLHRVRPSGRFPASVHHRAAVRHDEGERPAVPRHGPGGPPEGARSTRRRGL